MLGLIKIHETHVKVSLICKVKSRKWPRNSNRCPAPLTCSTGPFRAKPMHVVIVSASSNGLFLLKQRAFTFRTGQKSGYIDQALAWCNI